MAPTSERAALLDADNVIRFSDARHFLEELAGRLGEGRAFVQTPRRFDLQAVIQVSIEAPGLRNGIPATAKVVFARDGFIGLEFRDFANILPKLDELGQRAEPHIVEEKTDVGPIPKPSERPDSDTMDELEPAPRHAPDRQATEIGPPPTHAGPAHADREGTVDLPRAPNDDPGGSPVQGLSTTDLPIPRIAEDGTIEVAESTDLLGLYLAQARHGLITVLGGAVGYPGDAVDLEIDVQGNRIPLSGEILAEEGAWVTLLIDDPSPIEAHLLERSEHWQSDVERLMGDASTGLADADGASEMTPLDPGPPAASPSSSPAVSPSSPSASPTSSPSQSPSPSPDDPPASSDAPAAAPTPPRLKGGTLIFDNPASVRHEMETNLKNAGLFVASNPLPLRSHHTMQVQIGDITTPLTIEGDVVFASGGKVGFSIAAVAEALSRLEEVVSAVERGEAVEYLKPSTLDLDVNEIRRAASRTDLNDIGTVSGTIKGPPSLSDLLELHETRIKGPSGLQSVTALKLVDFIAHNELRGVLELESGEQTKVVYFHGGSVAFIESQPYDEDTALGRVLINNKKIHEAALREGLEHSRQCNKPLGRSLVLLGSIAKKTLSAALREQARLKLEAAFTWSSGTFKWGPWREPPGDADLVLTKGLGIIARHLRNVWDAENYADIERLLGPNMSRCLVETDAGESISSYLGLGPKDLRFIQLQIDETRDISDAVTGSPIGRLASIRLVCVGLGVGMFRFADKARLAPTRGRSAANVSQTGRIKRELLERIAGLDSMNHFEVLGVHWSAHHRSYREAYEQVRNEFSLSQPHLKDAEPEIQALAKRAMAIVERAYETLANQTARVSYRKELFDKTERQYSAEMLMKQGEVALMRGDRVQAIEALETAVELNPSNRAKSLLMAAREGKRN